ncbi:hypothetical protein H8959_006992, partial [Pygathrix nigripes]
ARASCAQPSPGPEPPAALGMERIAEPQAARRASAGNQGDAPGTADNCLHFKNNLPETLPVTLALPPNGDGSNAQSKTLEVDVDSTLMDERPSGHFTVLKSLFLN